MHKFAPSIRLSPTNGRYRDLPQSTHSIALPGGSLIHGIRMKHSRAHGASINFQ